MTPYLKQCGPPAFSATFPPNEQAFWLAGSGGVVVPEGREGGRDIEIEDTGLDDDALIGEVYLKNALHPAHLDDHPIVEGECPAAEIGAGAAGHEGNAVLREQPDHGRHLLAGVHEHHCSGETPLEIRVVLVCLQVDSFGEHVAPTDDGLQSLHYLIGHRTRFRTVTTQICCYLTGLGGRAHETEAPVDHRRLSRRTSMTSGFNIADYRDLDPSTRVLMGPGPSDVPPRVLRAMAAPTLGHLDPEFLELMSETQSLLRAVLKTDNALTIPVSGTGSAGMEACFVNLVEPGDQVAIVVNGVFGTRMVDCASRLGAEVIPIEAEWGRAVSAEAVEKALSGKQPKMFAFVHAETSTGVLQPVADIGRLGESQGCAGPDGLRHLAGRRGRGPGRLGNRPSVQRHGRNVFPVLRGWLRSPSTRRQWPSSKPARPRSLRGTSI